MPAYCNLTLAQPFHKSTIGGNKLLFEISVGIYGRRHAITLRKMASLILAYTLTLRHHLRENHTTLTLPKFSTRFAKPNLPHYDRNESSALDPAPHQP